ncbi:hypothetical protein F4604DRAFT_1925407 [Suillus subluteus]|nr:hypothetical protein F4604DRAFT_1925407 [Suillus subluteus]
MATFLKASVHVPDKFSVSQCQSLVLHRRCPPVSARCLGFLPPSHSPSHSPSQVPSFKFLPIRLPLSSSLTLIFLPPPLTPPQAVTVTVTLTLPSKISMHLATSIRVVLPAAKLESYIVSLTLWIDSRLVDRIWLPSAGLGHLRLPRCSLISFVKEQGLQSFLDLIQSAMLQPEDHAFKIQLMSAHFFSLYGLNSTWYLLSTTMAFDSELQVSASHTLNNQVISRPIARTSDDPTTHGSAGPAAPYVLEGVS